MYGVVTAMPPPARRGAVPRGHAPPAAWHSPCCFTGEMVARQVHELFLLNVVLQLFDGVATLQGLACWSEGNPIIRASMSVLGTEQALLLFKANACACLVLLRRSAATHLAFVALWGSALLYIVLSFVPWSTRLLSLAF